MKKYAIFLAEGINDCPYHYLAATTRVNEIGTGYKGSGTLWKEHLNECNSHNYYIIHKTNNHEEHREVAIELSNILNITKASNFLNLMAEGGVGRDRIAIDLSNPEVKSLYRSQKKEINLLENSKLIDFIPLECCDDTYDGEEKMINNIYNTKKMEEVERVSWLSQFWSDNRYITKPNPMNNGFRAVNLELLKIKYIDKKERIKQLKDKDKYRKIEDSKNTIKKWINYESNNK